jgi:uncharacterized membrane protein YidH (DUF202 family)
MIALNRTNEERYRILVEKGVLTAGEMEAAEDAARARGREIEKILTREYGVERQALLQALSEVHNCPFIEYDERMPIAPVLLHGLDGERLSLSRWFPVIRDGNTVIIAANNPDDPLVQAEARKFFKSENLVFWVALEEDIQWFIQDFLHARVGLLIGTERTGLAFWRNTMAHWRTRMACYRTDLAKSRTDLAFLRWGLGFIALSDTLMRTHKGGPLQSLYWLMIVVGFALAAFGLSGYLKTRKSRLSPPAQQTLVEVTAATLHFLEDYHFIETATTQAPSKHTMLARLGDFLASHCSILYPSPSSRERTHLARERNVLAGQRTVAACYRTLYARARTGLAFIRTGVSFSGLGLGLMHYFGISLFTAFDLLLVLAGLLMAVDGILWYMPVRREQAELPRCPVPQ